MVGTLHALLVAFERDFDEFVKGLGGSSVSTTKLIQLRDALRLLLADAKPTEGAMRGMRTAMIHALDAWLGEASQEEEAFWK